MTRTSVICLAVLAIYLQFVEHSAARRCDDDDDCENYEFCNSQDHECNRCQKCSADVIKGVSGECFYHHGCQSRGVSCPNWCTSCTGDVSKDTDEDMRNACSLAQTPLTTEAPTTQQSSSSESALITTEVDNKTPGTDDPNDSTNAGIMNTPISNMTEKNSRLQLIAILIAPFIIICGMSGWYLIWKKKRRSSSREGDLIAMTSSITLETSDDFTSGIIHGLGDVWNHSICCGIIVRLRHKTIARVKNSEHEHNQSLPVSNLRWKDKIIIMMESRKWCRKQEIAQLEINCLKILETDIALTHAVIRCPSENGTFFMRISENGEEGGSGIGDPLPVSHGCREISNLRPATLYTVDLGTRQGRDTNWQWRTQFRTKSLTIRPQMINETSATLMLSESIPDSLEVYVGVNHLSDDRLVRVSGQQFQCQNLVPGLEQYIRLVIRENCTSTLLQELHFRTSGCIEDGGNYEGDVTTTDVEGCPAEPLRSKERLQHGRLQCPTSLREALMNIRTSMPHFFQSADGHALNIMVVRLKQLFRKYHNQKPKKIFGTNNVTGLAQVENYLMSRYALQDYCSIFDMLRKFAESHDVNTEEGFDLAMALYNGHSRPPEENQMSGNGPNCPPCRQAIFILEKRRQHSTLSQTSACI